MRYVRRNPVPVIVITGIVWLLIFDRDSILYQFKINREIRQLEEQNRLLEKKIDSTSKILKKMHDRRFIRRYAREVLLLRKKNEDIYLLDTTAYEEK